ncbi:trans-sialidase, putative, partial [Trypanosoma cruzi marinkellei]
MRPPPQISQSFRRLLNCLPASLPLLLCGDSNVHHPQWEPFLEISPSEVAAEFLELCTDAGLTLVKTPLVKSRMPVVNERDPASIGHGQGILPCRLGQLTCRRSVKTTCSPSRCSRHSSTPYPRHPLVTSSFLQLGRCKWKPFAKDRDAQLPVCGYKRQLTG